MMITRVLSAATAALALICSAGAPAVAAGEDERIPTVNEALDAQAHARKVVYLTFDDGPNATYTPQLLALLRLYRAHATFFMVGREAAANPSLVKSVRAGGHAIGNHTYTHPALPTIPLDDVRSEIRKTESTLGGTTCVRPPFGQTDAEVNQVIASEGKNLALWTVDTSDWSSPGTNSIIDTVLRETTDGSVVLMHDSGGSRDQTVQALRVILPMLSWRGYRFETLPACR